MSSEPWPTDRRQFLANGLRVAGAVAAAATGGFLAGRQGSAAVTLWQIDPNKCIACSRCASECVLAESAVKAVQCFDMCGYCDICTGYFDPNYLQVNTAAENQMCPTNAVIRSFVEDKGGQRFYEYTIDEHLCIGCGKCVKGCALMNGSLYLQIMHDRCVNCNECAIGVSCPTQAISRVSAEHPYRAKRLATVLMKQKADQSGDPAAQTFVRQLSEP